MKTDIPTTTRLIDSPTLAVILMMIVAAIVLVVLAFSSTADDESAPQVSFEVAPPSATAPAGTAVASTNKRNLISIASPVDGQQVVASRAGTSSVVVRNPAAPKVSEERWSADDSATGTAPDALH